MGIATNRVLHGNKKEHMPIEATTTEGSQNNWTAGKKAATKDYILCDSIYKKLERQK